VFFSGLAIHANGNKRRVWSRERRIVPKQLRTPFFGSSGGAGFPWLANRMVTAVSRQRQSAPPNVLAEQSSSRKNGTLDLTRGERPSVRFRSPITA